jgi:hypothetical protein
VKSTIFCTDRGVPILKSDRLLRLLKELLRAAGIMEPYTANSIRHAMITTLCQLKGVGEKEVNAYAGHSNNAHTAYTNYYHLDHNWIGEALRKDSVVPKLVNPVAAGDNQEVGAVETSAVEQLALETVRDGKPVEVSAEVNEVLGLDSQQMDQEDAEGDL